MSSHPSSLPPNAGDLFPNSGSPNQPSVETRIGLAMVKELREIKDAVLLAASKKPAETLRVKHEFPRVCWMQLTSALFVSLVLASLAVDFVEYHYFRHEVKRDMEQIRMGSRLIPEGIIQRVRLAETQGH